MTPDRGVPPDLQAALAGEYELLRELGEGGMAVVYLARDLKHNREVAIKVLKSDLAAVVGEERFLGEIETTAKLQHPNILPLFDSGARDGFLYYAMPYVEGETLREKLKREVQLPVEDAVDLVRKIAAALDYAHEKGIVHRDIKPANILLSSGEPLIADFGIALAVSQANDGRRTETGLSLGTPHYMSPEQAAGDRSLDPRSDIYALGCILQELLTGEPPFSGANAQAVLARILTTRPTPVTTLRPTVPPHVESVIAKALEKLPADRFSAAKDFRKALVDPEFRHTVIERTLGTSSVPTQTRIVRSGVKPPVAAGIGAVALLLGLIAGGAVLGGGGGTTASGPSLRTTLDMSDLPGTEVFWQEVVISDDGSQLVWGSSEGLWLRGPQDERFRLLPGTENAEMPSFSPEGDWIAYGSGDDLWRVPVTGASPRRILDGDVLEADFGTWGPGGRITISGEDSDGVGLFRIPDTGGEPELLLRFGGEAGLTFLNSPFVLPDESGTLGTTNLAGTPGIVLHVIGEDSVRVLVRDALDPAYIDPGYLLFVTPDGDLFAQRFDLRTHALVGDAKPVLGGLRTQFSFARYSVADNGTLVIGTGPAAGGGSGDRELAEVGADGSRRSYDLRARDIARPRWSPDGRRVAWHGVDPDDENGDPQVWVYDTRLENRPAAVTEVGSNEGPVWSPDGSRVAFSSRLEGEERTGLFTKNPDTDAPPDSIWSLPGQLTAWDWPSDSLLVLTAQDPSRILTLTLGGDTTQYYAPDSRVDAPQVSPDGRWMAYSSNESGEWSVYARAFPDPGLAIRISSGAGDYPRWSPDGRTIYFTSGSAADSLYAADLELNPTLRVIRQRPVGTSLSWLFDVHPDGDRFLGSPPVGSADAEGDEARAPIGFHVIHNWFAELERIFDDGEGR